MYMAMIASIAPVILVQHAPNRNRHASWVPFGLVDTPYKTFQLLTTHPSSLLSLSLVGWIELLFRI
jgi:hypothetical protein